MKQEEIVNGTCDLRNGALTNCNLLFRRLHKNHDDYVTGAVRKRDDPEIVCRGSYSPRFVRYLGSRRVQCYPISAYEFRAK